MAAFLLRRLVAAVPLVFGVMVLVWLLLEALPGDYCDSLLSPDLDPRTIPAMRAALGCDAPAYGRFFAAMRGVLSLDFGTSVSFGRPVRDVVLDALPNTLLLSASALLAGQAIGGTAGIVQAVYHRRWPDTALSLLTLAFWSVPIFWLALWLQLGFGWAFATSGMRDPMSDEWAPWARTWDVLVHLVLPMTTLALAGAAGDSRLLRGSMVEALHQDYVRTARAKGVSEPSVVLRHALPNAVLPWIASLGLHLPALLSGSLIVENVFGWPGMGRVMAQALSQGDAPLALGTFFGFTWVVALGGILTDAAAALVDPRIRLER
ncbi:peptide ABC transporter permease [Deltaproteobacteria bacterium]|nr:peptide ABC transporter permease [Deltaproteobacteria bacterium]